MVALQRKAGESIEQYFARLRDKSDREDLLMFINSCFAATRQNEYYTDRFENSVSIEFLHQYILVNYREFYRSTLALGINHFNQALIIFNLLKDGAPTKQPLRQQEGELIRHSLRRLPPNRVYRLFESLQKSRVNNRRTRAVIRDYFRWRREPEFDAIKYRNKVRSAAFHSHLKLPGEIGIFLFQLDKQSSFETTQFENYRKAQYSAAHLYELPFTVAESFAAKHGVPPAEFLQKIKPRMTAQEKFRLQSVASRSNAAVDSDLTRVPLTKLVIYLLSLSLDERATRADEFELALVAAAKRALAKSPLKLGRVAAVLDQSRSSTGTRQRRNRPLAVAIACHYLLKAAASDFRAFWTPALDSKLDFQRRATGQSDLATPFLDALDWRPDMVVIVSDGFENDPPWVVNQLAEVYRSKIDTNARTEFLHANPVFDADHFSPRPLGTSIPTVGLRDAEDLPTMLGFARYASGSHSLSMLNEFVLHRVDQFLGEDAT